MTSQGHEPYKLYRIFCFLLVIFIVSCEDAPTKQNEFDEIVSAKPDSLHVAEEKAYVELLEKENTLPQKKTDKEFFLDEEPHQLNDQEFNKLSIRDKIRYAVTYPEAYLQICSIFPEPEDRNNKLILRLPQYLDGKSISKRQLDPLKANRDSSMFYLNDFLSKVNTIPRHYKELLIKLKATECIPNIIRISKIESQFDTYNLTVLMQLMSGKAYRPFLDSYYFQYLAKDQINKPTRSLPLTAAAKDSIFMFAEQLYKSK